MDVKKLETLGALADEVDGGSPDAQLQQQEQKAAEVQQLTDAQAWAAVPTMVGKLACMIAPELGAIYTAEACQAWGADMVPVAEKYGWGGPGALPELSLAISTAGFAIPTYLLVKARLAELAKAKKSAEGEGKPAADAARQGHAAVSTDASGAEPDGG